MEMDDDVSSDELHIDEEQGNRKRIKFTNTRGHHNAFSSNVGAYNDALLGFGGRGNAPRIDPLLPLKNVTPLFTRGYVNNTYVNDLYNIPAKSRTSSHKRYIKPGKVQSQRLDTADIDSTTAENKLSSSSFLHEMNMAMPGSLTSYNMETQNSYWGAANMSNQSVQKR